MSYEIYTYRLPGETAWDCGCESLSLEASQKAWSQLTLVGKGEHEGTNLTFDIRDLRDMPNEHSELAAYLDARFLLAHCDRVAREHLTPE